MEKLLKIGFVALLLGVLILGFKQLAFHKKDSKNTAPIQPIKEKTITIREGWSLRDIADYLESQKIVSATVFLSTAENFDTSEYPLLASRPKGTSLEGFLFPDTYRIYDYNTLPEKVTQKEIAEDIISKLLDNFSAKFTPEMEALADKSSLSLYEALTLASIIERETGRNAVTAEQKASLAEERGIVAGIFFNRLKIGMALQSDATVNYATGKNLPSPTLDDLEVNSAYNTYKNAGLPPTPIGNPSISSILAVLKPTNNNYFYFLHKQPSGEPVYSRTFEEHVANKNRYLK